MTERQDGGPAFPQPMAAMPTGEMYCASEKHPDFGGMTLRQWYAGQALGPLVAESIRLNHDSWLYAVKHAFIIADTMIAEGNKT